MKKRILMGMLVLLSQSGFAVITGGQDRMLQNTLPQALKQVQTEVKKGAPLYQLAQNPGKVKDFLGNKQELAAIIKKMAGSLVEEIYHTNRDLFDLFIEINGTKTKNSRMKKRSLTRQFRKIEEDDINQLLRNSLTEEALYKLIDIIASAYGLKDAANAQRETRLLDLWHTLRHFTEKDIDQLAKENIDVLKELVGFVGQFPWPTDNQLSKEQKAKILQYLHTLSAQDFESHNDLIKAFEELDNSDISGNSDISEQGGDSSFEEESEEDNTLQNLLNAIQDEEILPNLIEKIKDNRELKNALEAFLERRKIGSLDKLGDLTLGHMEEMGPVMVEKLIDLVKEILPQEQEDNQSEVREEEEYNHWGDSQGFDEREEEQEEQEEEENQDEDSENFDDRDDGILDPNFLKEWQSHNKKKPMFDVNKGVDYQKLFNLDEVLKQKSDESEKLHQELRQELDEDSQELDESLTNN